MKIHVWVPDYASGTGGIQTFSRFVVRALRDTYPNAEIAVVSKNDSSYPDPAEDWSNRFIPLGWWPDSLRTIALSAELFSRATRERPELVMTTHVNFAPVAQSLQKSFGIPYVAAGHGIEVWDVKDRNVRRALRAANRLLAVSEFTRERMATSLSLAVDLIGIQPNTFDPNKFTPGRKPRFLLKRYGLTEHQPVILTVGRLASAERYKGYDQVLRALPIVREQFPTVRYILGGRGKDRPRVEALIQELGIAEKVILAGYVPDHELREHYNLSDVFAMPSKGEGFGIVFLEALSCGKPVIAGNKDGSVDALLSGKLGTLVDPDDVAQLARAICVTLSQRSEVIGHQSEQLREQVIAAYGYERFRERLAENLAPLLGAKT